MDTNQIIITIGAIVLLGALMFLPQWQARRRREKQMEQMKVGSDVMTIGGIIGKLTYLNAEENRARIEVAPGVELTVIVNALNRTLPPAESEETADEASSTDA